MKHFSVKQFLAVAAVLLCLSVLCSAALAADVVTRTYYDDLQRQAQNGSQSGGVSGIPACDGGAGCPHLTVDEKGTMIGLCAYGRYMLSVDQAGLLRASAPEDLKLENGSNYIFRSTTYRLSGGGGSAALIVRNGISPAFVMGSAQVTKLTLLDGAAAALSSGAAMDTLEAVNGSLYLSGSQSFGAVNGSLTLAGSGVMTVGSLNAVLSASSSGDVRVVYTSAGAGSFSGWVKLDAPPQKYFTSAITSVQWNGAAIPLCFAQGSAEAYAPLPALPSGSSYRVALNDAGAGVECVITSDPQTTDYVITSDTSPLTIKGDGVLRGSGSQNVYVSAGASLEVNGARTSGGFAVQAGTTALKLYKSSSFGSLDAASGAKVVISGGGALRVQSFSGNISVDENTNFSMSIMPETLNGKKPTKIAIMESGGQPVANMPILLNIGAGGSISTTTDSEGYVTLWRSDKLTDVSAVALNGSTYAAVISNGSGEADALPVITSLTLDSRGNITVNCTNAGTIGVQYLIGTDEQDMPDAFLNTAGILYSSGEGRLTIPNLNTGDVVTLRAFAAKDTGVLLNAKTSDAFVFSPKRRLDVSTKLRFSLGEQRKVYDGEAFVFSTRQVPKKWKIEYYNRHNPTGTRYTSIVNEGDYMAVITVPADDPTYEAGSYEVSVVISRVRVEVYPYGDVKLKGQPDPRMMFDLDPDPEMYGDEVHGHLRRMAGEGYGNYPYYADQLYARDSSGNKVNHYYFVIAEDSPYFFIEWNRNHYMRGDPLSVINPVFDELHFGDGRVLSVQQRTADVLNLGGTYFGTLVVDTQTGQARPFTPSLRVRKGEDRALIILTAEAELNKDGGYTTDRDGAKEWRSRTLVLGFGHINKFAQQHVKDIAFSLKGTTLLLDMADLTSELMTQTLQENGLPKLNTRFCFELTPVVSAEGLSEGEQTARRAVIQNAPVMRVKAYLENGSSRVDISALLPNAKLLFDAGDIMTLGKKEAESASDITETVNGKPVEKTAAASSQEQAAISALMGEGEDETLLDLGCRLLDDEIRRGGYALRRYQSDGIAALDSATIVPYTSSESRSVSYSALMRIRPYMMMPFNQNGVYGLEGS